MRFAVYAVKYLLIRSSNVKLSIANSFVYKNLLRKKPGKTPSPLERRFSYPIHLIRFHYLYYLSLAKYSFANLNTVPESRKTAIRLGIIISPLNVSAMFQIKSSFRVAPIIETAE